MKRGEENGEVEEIKEKEKRAGGRKRTHRYKETTERRIKGGGPGGRET